MLKNKSKVLFIFSVICILLLSGVSNASNDEFNQKQNVLNYVNIIQKQNMEYSKQEIGNIPVTITLTKAISLEELKTFVDNTEIEIVMVQARGFDQNGDRITFISKTHKGFDETQKILLSMAKEDNVEFSGYNAIFALVNTNNLEQIENNEFTYLADTSSYNLNSYETANSTEDESNLDDTKYSFPHSLAWELEDL